MDQGIAMAAKLFRKIFPESKIVAFGDVDPTPTTRNEIDVTQEFLDVRLGKALRRKRFWTSSNVWAMM